LIFGTRAEVDRVASRIRLRHSTIRGRIDRRMGKYPAGTIYAADDPELLMWVHGACVDTALVMYGTFVRRISGPIKEEFYEEMKAVASMLGVPANSIPATLADFYSYLRSRMASEICVTEAAREIAGLALNPPVPAELRALTTIVRAVTITMLPSEIRALYDLDCSPASRLILAGSAPSIRRLLMPLVPRHARLVWRESSARGPEGLTFGMVAALAERRL
jgi:uncharacterized protein (DUF2236 family)